MDSISSESWTIENALQLWRRIDFNSISPIVKSHYNTKLVQDPLNMFTIFVILRPGASDSISKDSQIYTSVKNSISDTHFHKFNGKSNENVAKYLSH